MSLQDITVNKHPSLKGFRHLKNRWSKSYLGSNYVHKDQRELVIAKQL